MSSSPYSRLDISSLPLNSHPAHVGILALDVYFPKYYVRQTDLETFTNVSAGKYTIGLGQTSMAFVSDREDIYSLMLSALDKFMSAYGIAYEDIGKLAVGTETILDHAKSIKSVLMQLFEANGKKGNAWDVEGIDLVNACYGGTAALFSCLDWVESSSWDGRLAIAICGDIAEYEEGPARPSGGAGIAVMLIGPNAPLVVDRRLRSSHFEHSWDFYKSNMHSPYPLVDGKFSASCYLRALDACYATYADKIKKFYSKELILAATAADEKSAIDTAASSSSSTSSSSWPIDYFIFHSPYNKLVQKSFGRLFYNDYLRHPALPSYSTVPSAFGSLSKDASYGDATLEKFFMALSKSAYDKKVAPSTLLPQQLGNCYTGSLYVGLASLLFNIPAAQLADKRFLLFSYGSGLASSIFSLTVRSDSSSLLLLSKISSVLNLSSRLSARVAQPPAVLFEYLERRAHVHGLLAFEPSAKVDVQSGAFYLVKKDDKGRRWYEKADENGNAKQSENGAKPVADS